MIVHIRTYIIKLYIYIYIYVSVSVQNEYLIKYLNFNNIYIYYIYAQTHAYRT